MASDPFMAQFMGHANCQNEPAYSSDCASIHAAVALGIGPTSSTTASSIGQGPPEMSSKNGHLLSKELALKTQHSHDSANAIDKENMACLSHQTKNMLTEPRLKHHVLGGVSSQAAASSH